MSFAINNTFSIERTPPKTLDEAITQADVICRKFHQFCEHDDPLCYHEMTMYFHNALHFINISKSRGLMSFTSLFNPNMSFWRFRDTIEELAQDTAQLAEASPTILRNQINSTKQGSQLSIKHQFLIFVFEKARERIKISPFIGLSRFIYRIQWQGQLTGYLIGTVHMVSTSMAFDSALHETVKKCKHLFFELAPQALLGIGCQGYFAPLDTALAKTALKNNIFCEGLESLSYQKQFMDQFVSWTIANNLTDGDEYYSTELLYAYQTRDAQKFYSLGQNSVTYEIIALRNQEWLNGFPNLIERLKSVYSIEWPKPISENPQETLFQGMCRSNDARNHTPLPHPIGIVVGVLHCLGPDGLVLQLRKAGFTVSHQ
jgi:hypothetical protein